jgi:hypothetical protein
MYVHDSSPAFSLYRFIFCIGIAGTSFMASETSFLVIVGIAFGTSLASAAAYISMRLHHMPPPEQHSCPCSKPSLGAGEAGDDADAGEHDHVTSV